MTKTMGRDTGAARERTVAFFRGVTLGNAAPDAAVVWKVVRDDGAARDLQVEPVERGDEGRSFLDLKEGMLSAFYCATEGWSQDDERALHDLADEVSADCTQAVGLPDDDRYDEWLDDLEGDARGIFFSECFPDVEACAEARRFFDVVRAAYAAGGVPCGLPDWPAAKMAIYV
ncbi:MAG: hypothetical protein IT379_08505 [Deltaproteobacteria bacterium]|nr:hypothetical protein [Deltaproteobacteria bacterium]